LNNPQRQYYLNSLGLINALGSGKSTVANHLFAGATSGMVALEGYIPNTTTTLGQVDEPLPQIPQALAKHNSRNNQLLLSACQQIESEIEAMRDKYGASRIGVVLGSSTSGIGEGEQAIFAEANGEPIPEPYHYQQQEMGDPALFLRAYYGLKNVAYTVSVACSSSTKALASAQRLLDHGICDAVIVGGVDSLCRLTVNGFHSLESVSTSLCMPFSKNRCGINIGEAAAVFILSSEAGPIRLCGVGESSDAHHMSAPDPTGQGAMRAMQMALEQADLTPEAIDYLNLHGTATKLNDNMEGLAVSTLFGDQLACSSTKALVGHTLGAAGATELAFCWLTLSSYNTQGLLPPHIFDGEYDSAIPPLNLVARGVQCAQPRYAMSNSFAFGGNNVSVVIGRA